MASFLGQPLLPYDQYLREKLVHTASGSFMCTLCGNQQKYREVKIEVQLNMLSEKEIYLTV